MPDPFDDARRALDEVPAPDRWDEATRRAADGSVVPLTPGGDRRRPTRRWLAAGAMAAVAVLAVGTAAVILDDDEADVDSGPVSDGEAGVVPLVPPTMDFSYNDGCAFGLDSPRPYEVVEDDVPSEGPRQQQKVALGLGNEQTATIAVPGMVVTDLVGERVEDVELVRGTAQVWLTGELVQVRWFPGGQDPCESFTVTVEGSTEDGNRHVAIDLADQVRLPSDLGAALAATLDGDWELEGGHLVGEPFDGNGLRFSFADGTATWTDGCSQRRADYELAGATSIVIRAPTSTRLGCASVDDTARKAIFAVMSSPMVSTTPNAVVLTEWVVDGAATDLRLRLVDPPDVDVDEAEIPALAKLDGEWQLERSEVGGETIDGSGVLFTFQNGSATWTDGCNSYTGRYGPDASPTVRRMNDSTQAMSTAADCPANPTAEAVQTVMSAPQVVVGGDGGLLVLRAGDATLTLRPRDAP